jgi:hypothetical protein
LFTQQQLASILSSLPDPAFILTRSGRYAAVFGGKDVRHYHDGSGLVGMSMFDVLKQEKAQWFADEVAKALRSRVLHIVEYQLCGSDVKGSGDGPDYAISFEGRVQALGFPVDGEDAVVWVASNITEKNEVQCKLRLLSETDALTGLYNRRKLIETLDDRLAIFERERDQTSVLVFDLDNFKRLNDEMGHHAGDAALVEIARLCRQNLRHWKLPNSCARTCRLPSARTCATNPPSVAVSANSACRTGCPAKSSNGRMRGCIFPNAPAATGCLRCKHGLLGCGLPFQTRRPQSGFCVVGTVCLGVGCLSKRASRNRVSAL